MHVLQVSPYFPPTWAYGGIPRIVYGLSRALVQRGHRVTVWTTDAFDADSRSAQSDRHSLDGIDVRVSKNWSNRLAYRHQLFLPRSLTSAFEGLDDVDLVHLHGHRHLLNTAAIRWAKSRGIPWVFTPNGTLPRQEQKQILKLLWDPFVANAVPRDASACVAVSRAEVGQMTRSGIPRERITQIPNGLMLEEFEALPSRGDFKKKWGIDSPIVSYLGRISPRKGVEHLTAAFAGDALQNAQLVIAGNDMGALATAQSAADERVLFTGLLEGRERLSLLVDSDVLVYPSSDEIFGLVPFEGLMCGAPVVVGGDCGCGQLIREAGAGLLVNHADVTALQERIRYLLSDREAASAMVDRGRDYVMRELSFSTVAEQPEALYARVLGGLRES